jgi:3-oxoacyl-[acyl-carrier protein] reductase
VSLELAQEGSHVIVNYAKSEGPARETVEEIIARGGTAEAWKADVSDEPQVRRMFSSIKKVHGRVDVLVNNAGVTNDGFLVMMSARKFESVLGTNLMGTFLCSREALRIMAHQRRGSIVNISSLAGLAGAEGQSNYSASKGAVIAFTRSLAREGGPMGVRANVVAPGLIDTDMIRTIPPPVFGGLMQLVTLGRVGTPQEVANLVAFIASPKASYMTGRTYVIDGGMSVG